MSFVRLLQTHHGGVRFGRYADRACGSRNPDKRRAGGSRAVALDAHGVLSTRLLPSRVPPPPTSQPPSQTASSPEPSQSTWQRGVSRLRAAIVSAAASCSPASFIRTRAVDRAMGSTSVTPHESAGLSARTCEWLRKYEPWCVCNNCSTHAGYEGMPLSRFGYALPVHFHTPDPIWAKSRLPG